MIYVIKRSQIPQLRQPPEHAACLARKPLAARLPASRSPPSLRKPKELRDWLGQQGAGSPPLRSLPPTAPRVQTDFSVCLGRAGGGGRDDGRGCLTLALNQRDYELRDNTHSFQKAARRGTRVYVGSGAEGHIPPTPIPKIKMNPRSPTSLEPDLSHQKKSSVLIA